MTAQQSARAQQLEQAAKQYIELVGRQPEGSSNQLEEQLRKLISPDGVTYEADGVLRHEDATLTPEQLAKDIQQQHKVYRHTTYRPIAISANDDSNTAFLAVHYELENIGSYADRKATNRVSTGYLVEKLTFDGSDRITSSLLCRQPTVEERDVLLKDPASFCPAVVVEKDLQGPPLQSNDERDKMSQAVRAWTDAWHNGGDIEVLNSVLDSDVTMLDGYGTMGKGVLFSGVEAAKEQVKKVQEQVSNKSTLLAFALDAQHKVAFQHWGQPHGTPVEKASGKPKPISGLGLVVFNPQTQIKYILEFTMMPNGVTTADVPAGHL